MLKINLVVTCLKVGGQEKIVAWLADMLASKKYEISIILLGFESETVLKVSKDVNLIYLDLDNKYGTIRWFNFFKQIKKFHFFNKSLLYNNPDVIISFGDKTNIEVLLACILNQNTKFIVSEQSDLRMHYINFRLNFFRKILYIKANYVVVISESLFKYCVNKFKFWNVKKISNPIDINYSNIYSTKPKYYNKKNIISLCRLIDSKRVELIIIAFSKLYKNYPDWNLIIIGDGPCFNSLKKLSEDLLLDNRVYFTGQIFPPYDLLKYGDFFITASSYESFGISIGEALSLGLPAISFDVLSGPRDIIINTFNGFLIPDNNFIEFTNKIELLMLDDNLRNRLSKNAIKVIDKFSPIQIFTEWENLINT